MSEKRLEEIEREIRRLDGFDDELESLKLQSGNVRSRDLERIAAAIGMTRQKKQRGEPKWRIGTHFVPIPSHPKPRGKGMGIKLCKQLQAVIFELREALADEKNEITKKKNQFRNWR